jgi:hypothetical protein
VNSYGPLLALVLAGAWRPDPEPLEISAQALSKVVPLLNGSGAGALVWHRIRKSDLRDSSPARQLQEAYRLQTLQAAIYESNLALGFQTLTDSGINPILLKGWSVARLYPETGLRPSGDIDLFIPQGERAKAQAVLRQPGCQVRSVVDLKHEEFDALNEPQIEELYARSYVLELEGARVRVLGPEDQLRFLCLHLWKHSAYRPIWLCDIAVSLESQPDDFDWELCLRGDEISANWIACAVSLARNLLGAEWRGRLEGLRTAPSPAWLRNEVLKQWETPCTDEHLPLELMAQTLRRPWRVFPALVKRWPDPIRTHVSRGRDFNSAPNFYCRLIQYTSQSRDFLMRLMRSE